jgi:feruloyl esterase
MMRTRALVALLAWTVTLGSAQAREPSVSCEALSSLSLQNTTITLAQPIPGGTFALPGVAAAAQPKSLLERLPPFCRVTATMKPTNDSDIKIEVWLPGANWNGKFQAIGNGGWAGQIPRGAMLEPLEQGYATASTDTGHDSAGASFAVGHAEKLIDYSYRAVHEMTTAAKAIIAAYYGKEAALSYWTGCSLGGQQGFKEAQLYPADYDGIIAGAPTYNRTHLHAWQLHMGHTALEADNANRITASKVRLIYDAVLAACDASDGVKDGLLNNPPQCHFDPAQLLCKADDSEHCLTGPQVEIAKQLYAATVDPQTGRVLYPGVPPGTELGWGPLVGGSQPFGLATDLFKYVVHQDPNWDWREFDLSRDTAVADEKYGATLNAEDADLREFRARGGKLLVWHGWADSLVPPQGTIDYYNRVVSTAGPNAEDFIRLFMAPGVQHCGGGPGPNQFNAIAAMELWRESETSPNQLTASRVTGNRVDMTRPLCPYPQVAQYKGRGTVNDIENFICKAP